VERALGGDVGDQMFAVGSDQRVDLRYVSFLDMSMVRRDLLCIHGFHDPRLTCPEDEREEPIEIPHRCAPAFLGTPWRL
jgi:hypothetical protein